MLYSYRQPALLVMVLALSFSVQWTPFAHAVGCPGSMPLFHDPARGAFVIPELSGRGDGPPIRFWGYGHYMQANNGTQGQYLKENGLRPWFTQEPECGPDEFILVGADWQGPNIAGCPLGSSDRTVVEVSYSMNEGQPSHYTFYIVAAVRAMAGSFDFSSISGGNGRRPGDVQALPIPPPVVTGPATTGTNAGFMNVRLSLPEAPSFGDDGAPKLVKGYRILYVNDEEPVTGYVGGYRPVLEPQNPGQAIGLVAPGTVEVAVPVPTKASYFVSVLVYDDPTAELVSNGSSAHAGPVYPPGDATKPGDKDSKKPDSQETPTPTPTPTPDTEEPTGPSDAQTPTPTPQPTPTQKTGEPQPTPQPTPRPTPPTAPAAAPAATPVAGTTGTPQPFTGGGNVAVPVPYPVSSGDRTTPSRYTDPVPGRESSVPPDRREGSEPRSAAGDRTVPSSSGPEAAAGSAADPGSPGTFSAPPVTAPGEAVPGTGGAAGTGNAGLPPPGPGSGGVQPGASGGVDATQGRVEIAGLRPDSRAMAPGFEAGTGAADRQPAGPGKTEVNGGDGSLSGAEADRKSVV